MRDTTDAIKLPFSWYDLRKIMFVCKSGREAEVLALEKPIYRVLSEGNASESYRLLEEFDVKPFVHSWVDEKLWWNNRFVGYFASIISVMHLYEYQMRDPIKEVYAEARSGDFMVVELYPHYRMHIAEFHKRFEKEGKTGDFPKMQSRSNNEMRNAFIQNKLAGNGR